MPPDGWRETARGTVASRELGSRGCLRATSGNTADTAWAVLPPARAPTPPPRQALAGIQIRSARRIRAGATSARRDRMPASRRSALASRARNAVRQDAGATHAVAGWRQVDRASSARIRAGSGHARKSDVNRKLTSRARVGARSASRWQYCQAVSAVLPEVARRASSRARLARRHPSRAEIESRAEANSRGKSSRADYRKIDFGIITCTPTVPSTNCVMSTSLDTLTS